MMTNPVGSLQASSAAFRWMQNASLLASPSFKGDSKNLELEMQQDSFRYKTYMAMDDMNERIKKQNIKRSFDIFA